MKVEDKKIKASEVVGELNRAARMYEIFKQAADAAKILAEKEKREADLIQAIEKLSKEKSQLDTDCDLVYNKILKHKEELASTQGKVKEADVYYASVLKQAESRARQEADNIVAQAKTDLEKLHKEIATQKSILESTKASVESSRREFDKIVSKIKAAKEKAIADLGL